MHTNPLRARLDAGTPVLNGWLTIPSAVAAEAMGRAGFHSATVDLQHGPIGFETALTMLQALAATPATPLVRVPWNEPAPIMRALDAGADACARFVAACRYPPDGRRSWGPTRAQLAMDGYESERANREVLTFAMIETGPALDNLDAILATPGLDAVYVGPADLSQALGIGPTVRMGADPLASALRRIADACARHGVIAGVHTGSVEDARAMRSLGYRFVTVRSDLAYLEAGAHAVAAALSENAPPDAQGPRG